MAKMLYEWFKPYEDIICTVKSTNRGTYFLGEFGKVFFDFLGLKTLDRNLDKMHYLLGT